MPVPSEPYIDMVTGEEHGDIMESGNFSWYNPGTGNCTVSNCSSWCTSASYTVGGGLSQMANVKAVSGDAYSFSSTCLAQGEPSPVIIVHPVIEGMHKKTA